MEESHSKRNMPDQELALIMAFLLSIHPTPQAENTDKPLVAKFCLVFSVDVVYLGPKLWDLLSSQLPTFKYISSFVVSFTDSGLIFMSKATNDDTFIVQEVETSSILSNPLPKCGGTVLGNPVQIKDTTSWVRNQAMESSKLRKTFGHLETRLTNWSPLLRITCWTRRQRNGLRSWKPSISP